jgi:hypothetical protein
MSAPPNNCFTNVRLAYPGGEWAAPASWLPCPAPNLPAGRQNVTLESAGGGSVGPMNTRKGVFRRVLRTRGLALKIPRIRHPLLGMRCNRWEREMWRVWRLKFRWEHLCPVLAADPFGFVVVMPHATQDVSEQELEAFVMESDAHPEITSEWDKLRDWGHLDGRIVALDYGLWDADTVKDQRDYYSRTAKT